MQRTTMHVNDLLPHSPNAEALYFAFLDVHLSMKL